MLNFYHITCVTHNSRVSERMRKYGIKRGIPVTLNENDEINITKTISSLIKRNKWIFNAFNICKDHIHFVVFCEDNKLTSIVQNVKSITSRKYTNKKISGSLWAQKFNRKMINNDEQLFSAITYITNNRFKHELPENPVVDLIISQMIFPIDRIEELFLEREKSMEPTQTMEHFNVKS